MESSKEYNEHGFEQNESGAGFQKLTELADKFDQQQANEVYKGKEQLLHTLAKAAEVQHAFEAKNIPVPVLTFDAARQVLEQYYTGQASTYWEGAELGLSVPRYLAVEWAEKAKDENLPANERTKLPVDGYTIELNAKADHDNGPTGEDMLKVNDILVNTPDKERIKLFCMNKDDGEEGTDWQYVTIDNATVKVETLPKFIDNFIFWRMYQKEGEPNKYTSDEARKVLKLAKDNLLDNEKNRLDEGFFSEDYIAKLEYCITKNDQDFVPTTSPEKLKEVEEEIKAFQSEKDNFEAKRLDLIDKLKKAKTDEKTLEEITNGALRDYKEKIQGARNTANDPEDFVKKVMDGMTDNEIYKIVFGEFKNL